MENRKKSDKLEKNKEISKKCGKLAFKTTICTYYDTNLTLLNQTVTI